MSKPLVGLPTIQNWSCHNCSGCCRQHVIEITAEEKQRIEKQKWSDKDGVPADSAIVPFPGSVSGWRLGHQDDGGCAFLDEAGLCRIHAKFGEDAKPLACRIYPYTFHPSGGRFAVSLRFSCPSVVANKGRAVTDQKRELEKLARLVMPDGTERTPPPPLSAKETMNWTETRSIISAMDALMADVDEPFLVRLLRVLFFIDTLEQASFEKIRGERLDELLQIVSGAARAQVESLPGADAPNGLARIYFRMLVAQYARRDTGADIGAGFGKRLQLLRAATMFALGRGQVPVFREPFREVPFADVESTTGECTNSVDELLTRYVRIKLQGIHFCGPAYYDIPLFEGFRHLALIVPAIGWLARWLAVGAGREVFTDDDVMTAIAVADHNHGFSQAFGQRAFRSRVRSLATMKQIVPLCVMYSAQ